MLPSVCTDSGWEIRNTEWRTSLAVNSPHCSWNLMPLRSQTVQRLPSGAISHFSASCGMYAPVWRSIPTRYSRAGRLSSWPLRLCSQVKLVSQPRGATAMRNRSSFAACAGVATSVQATIATKLITHSTPTIDALRSDFCIHDLLRCLLRMRVRRGGAGATVWREDSGCCTTSVGILRMQLSTGHCQPKLAAPGVPGSWVTYTAFPAYTP